MENWLVIADDTESTDTHRVCYITNYSLKAITGSRGRSAGIR